MISFALRQGFEREDERVIATQGHELEGLMTSQTRCVGVSGLAIWSIENLPSND
jgi:hypothetical protein